MYKKCSKKFTFRNSTNFKYKCSKKGEQSKLQIATKFIETNRYQKLSKSRILNDLDLDFKGESNRFRFN